MANSASAIKAAEVALEKGDYNFCIKIVDPLLLSYTAETKIGGQLRLLKVTAYIGRGDEKEAIEICQLLVNNREPTVRQQAKQLLSILDAPSLPRPANWSVEIPKIEIEQSIKSSFSKTKKQKKEPNYPPTGPTKNLDLGFSMITLTIIILITFVLSGCVDISTNFSVKEADRLNILLDLDSNRGELIPWQIEFAEYLSKENSALKIEKKENMLHIETQTIRFEEANTILQQITSSASKASGLNIKKPEITISNKNLIIGTKQNFKFYFDLSNFPKIPGLRLSIIFNDIGDENSFTTSPLKPTFNNGLMSLPLQIGQINLLEVSYWKWNKISVGIILIISITLISIFLQTFRLKMGFGFPELPP